MKIYDYMAARAKSEGMEHTLLRKHYQQWVNQGVRSFFGVLVDDTGTPISDNQSPAFFEEWEFFARSTSPEQEGMAQ